MTVAVLAIGLFATGIGATAFLRNALIQNLDTSLEQLVVPNVASGLFDIDTSTGRVSARDDALPTDYFVALYAPEGEFIISAGGRGPKPAFPNTFTLAQTTIQGVTAFPLPGVTTDIQFHASVAAQEFPGIAGYYTQMVVLPLSSANRVVNTFLGIFGILALITIVAGLLLTRWIVTLTFRGLGEVESTAMAIAGGDFSQRMTEVEPRTEVGRLKLALNTMLTRVDAALGQRDASVAQMRRFIGDASHELRTPLVSVRGYAELYRMGAISGEEDTAQAMERIEKEAIRMTTLVEDLLALARLDERRDVVIVPVDLRPVARDAVLDIRATAPGREVRVVDTTAPAEPEVLDSPTDPHADEPSSPSRRRNPPPTSAIARAGATLSLLRRKPRPVPASQATTALEAGAASPPITPVDLTPATATPTVAAPPIVLGDENRIRQVVANLVGNALRYTPDDSPIEVTVGVATRAGMGWIAVVDHGDGIPDPIKAQIFQRFWRADSSRARETGGSGLGLSIVASIVAALHGEVTVADTPGHGATFRASFPLAAVRDASEHLLIETQPIPRLSPDLLD